MLYQLGCRLLAKIDFLMSRKRRRHKNKGSKIFNGITSLSPQFLLNRDAKRWRYFISMMEKSEPGAGNDFIRIVDRGIAAEESLSQQVKQVSRKKTTVYQR